MVRTKPARWPAFFGGLPPSWAAVLGWLPAVLVALPFLWARMDAAPSDRSAVALLEVAGYSTLAAVSYLVAWGWRKTLRLGTLPAFFVLFVGLEGLAWLTLANDLSAASERLSDPVPPGALLALFVTAAALLVTFAAVAGYLLGKTRFWLLAPGAAVSMLVGNALVLRGDYPAVHLFWVLGTACLVGAALLPGCLAREERRLAPVAAGAVGVISIAAMWGAPAAIRSAWLQASQPPAYVLFGSAPRLFGPRLVQEDGIAHWYLPSPVPEHRPPIVLDDVPQQPVVLLVTIDALRADVAHGEVPVELPTLTAIRGASVVFRNARAPATLTKVSVASTFMSRYFSQQYWTKDRRGYLLPKEDPAPRFPEVLKDAGVRTVSFRTIGWLRNANGHVRGFDEDTFVEEKGAQRKYTSSGPAIDAILRRLSEVGDEPLLLHTHLSDPHAPYDLGGRKGTAFQRYLAEVAYVDRQLGRFVSYLQQSPLRRRTVLLITSDHGEAFGEHGARTHGTTLYDEELRVPLFLRIPGVDPKEVDALVSTIDIAPTVLDLFGVPTPPEFMGRSLLGHLVADDPYPGRPIAAEGRLRRAMAYPDGLKVISDTRTGEVELYDLETDPDEQNNIADRKARLAEPLGKLERFFEAHRLKEPGYEPPYIR